MKRMEFAFHRGVEVYLKLNAMLILGGSHHHWKKLFVNVYPGGTYPGVPRGTCGQLF